MEHPTDMCPTLQETNIESTESVEAIGGEYQYGRGNCICRIRIKGSIQPQDLDQLGTCRVRVRASINIWVRDATSYHSASRKNNKCHLEKILLQWKT
ncbi:hypothetical protein CR513_52373, partial [Mucuna pruriens]